MEDKMLRVVRDFKSLRSQSGFTVHTEKRLYSR